jgi:hypothetical protein
MLLPRRLGVNLNEDLAPVGELGRTSGLVRATRDGAPHSPRPAAQLCDERCAVTGGISLAIISPNGPVRLWVALVLR